MADLRGYPSGKPDGPCTGWWYYSSITGYQYQYKEGELLVEQVGKPTRGPSTGTQPHETELGAIKIDETLKLPPPGDYPIYRLMDSHPTLSLVRGIIIGQVMSGAIGVEAQQGTPKSDEKVKLINASMLPHVKFLICENMRALSMKWQPWETIWGDVNLPGFSGPQQVPVEFKPLIPEFSTPLVDKFGNFVGIRNISEGFNQTDIWGSSAYVYGYGREAKRVIGRSRHENCRATAWWGWVLANEESMKLDAKASGRVFSVAGPPDAKEQSKVIAKSLTSGKSAFMSNWITAAHQRQQNVDAKVLSDLAKVTGYYIQQWDLGNYAASQDAIINKLRYHDASMFRAWHRPERSGTEGQRGTLAEAQEHGGVAVTDSDYIHGDILTSINKGPVDTILVNKYGPEARGSAFLKPGPLTALNAETDMVFINAALTDPMIRVQVMEQIDLDAIISRRNIPKLKDVLTIVIKQVAEQQGQLNPGAPPQRNGNGAATSGASR
jgi:hypothetical protein